MKLTQRAIEKITDSKSLPRLLAKVLKVSRVTMWRYLKENSDELTKAAAIKIIREETGLSDSEILEEEPTEAAAA